MNRRNLLISISVITLLFCFSAYLFAGGAQEEQKPSVKAKIIKFSHVGTPDDARNKAALIFKEMVESKTDGAIQVEIFTGGQLGGDRDAIEGLKIGTIQMTVAGAGIFANFEPKMGITALPFLFENFEDAWAFNDSEINKKVSDLLLEQGIRVLSYWENGFRCLTNSVRPIQKAEDVKGMKIRTPENPIILATMKSLGASPSPLPWPEVYMALQQKAFDGQENPIPVIYIHKIYEVQKYLAITNHVYEPMPLVISESFYKELTAEQKEIVQNAAQEAKVYNRDLIKKQTEEMVDKLKDEGMIITYPDLNSFREAAKSVGNDFIDNFGEKLIKDAYNFSK